MTTRLMNFCLTLLFLLSMFSLLSCSSDEPLLTGGPHYFKTFANYYIPFQPVGLISKDEAKKHRSYYVAFYNDNGQIKEFAKYLDGELVFKDVYTYDDKGKLHKRILTNLSTNKESVGYFDEIGNLKVQRE